MRADDHATPSVGMYNGECFMFYGSHTGVRALRVLGASRPECVPMTGSAGAMTHTEAVRVDIMCNGSGSVQQYNAMTTDTRKPMTTPRTQ